MFSLILQHLLTNVKTLSFPHIHISRKVASLIFACLTVLLCGFGMWSWRATAEHRPSAGLSIMRYDRVLDEYVTLGSYTALHRMNTNFPAETKVLIENILELGRVTEPDIEMRLRHYYLDSTVQTLLHATREQYADMSDIERELQQRFSELQATDPSIRLPRVFTFISCLHESIVVTDTLIGISLDKYLGSDFPLYSHFYTPEQRQQMTRRHIVDDAVAAYLQHLRQP